MKAILDLSTDHQRAAELFRALGNPARVRILQELAARGSCVTGDLADVLPLAPSTISEHLRVLKEAGIVRGPVDRDPCYCLEPGVLRWLSAFIAGVCTGAEACDTSDPRCC